MELKALVWKATRKLASSVKRTFRVQVWRKVGRLYCGRMGGVGVGADSFSSSYKELSSS